MIKKTTTILLSLGLLAISINPALAKEGREDVQVGPIWNVSDAQQKCKRVQDEYPHNHSDIDQARWTGQWKTTKQGKMSVCGIRYISRKDWTDKPIDSRAISRSEYIKDCTQKNKITNGWINDDKCRDRLVMDTSKLDHVIVVDGKEKIAKAPSGRYIFVLRKNDNQLVLRRYDRSHRISSGQYDRCNNDAYLYKKNIETIKDKNNRHVRHSQVNGSHGEADAWNPVWSAGELWIENGKIIAISNESGHFKPSSGSLQYVKQTLNYLSLPADNIKFYDAASFSQKNELDQLKNKCLGGKKEGGEL